METNKSRLNRDFTRIKTLRHLCYLVEITENQSTLLNLFQNVAFTLMGLKKKKKFTSEVFVFTVVECVAQ